MSQLPATGTAISMGRMSQAYLNTAAGTTVSVGATLNPIIGRSTTINTPLSNVFGGLTTPYTY